MGGSIRGGVARSITALLILTGSIGVVGVTGAAPALADNCTHEQPIFVQASDSSTYGTQGKKRQLDSNCAQKSGSLEHDQFLQLWL
jgi:hypothetical protein